MNTRTSIRRRGGILAATVALAAPFGVAASTSAAQAATPYCGITWGSLTKSSSTWSTSAITAVRYGEHTCYDRLVIDLGKGRNKVGYSVRYVSTVRTQGGGFAVPVTGAADLQIDVNAPALKKIPTSGTINFSSTTWSAFRQLKWAGSFEGQTTYALGVRARLPMRVFVIADAGGTQRLVIDVAHRW